jgi:hypothetical protein
MLPKRRYLSFSICHLKRTVTAQRSKDNELFPSEYNLLTKEIESWRGFADSLNSQQYKELFNKMLNDCHKYAAAIKYKREPFPTEPLIMAYYCPSIK